MGWDDTRTAELYDRFTREFPLYDQTSRDLVRLADLTDAQTAIDLACGTGVTSRAALEVLPSDARLVAIDGSEAMLGVAKRSVTDPRVRWVCADAANLADHVETADAIVCNSAIWQTDMPAVFEAAGRGLAPGGRLAFNVGRQFIMLPFTPEETERGKPTLRQYVQTIATLDHDYVPAHAGRRMRPLSREGVEEMLRAAGLVPHTFEVLTYESTAAADRAWLKVPVFADNLLRGLPYPTQAEIIDTAYERVDPASVSTTRWAYFVASRT